MDIVFFEAHNCFITTCKTHFSTSMTTNRSGISQILSAIMFGLQRAQNRRISYASMADKLGVSERAFSEWMRGAREPAAMEALLDMLAMLADDEVARVLDVWRSNSSPVSRAVGSIRGKRGPGKTSTNSVPKKNS